VRETRYVDELPPVPPYGSVTGRVARVDWLHDAAFVAVQSGVARFDRRFGGDGELERVPVSEFRVGVYVEATDADGTEVEFDPEVKIELELPNIERRLSLFVETLELDELPGTDPTERDSTLHVGLRRDLFKNFDLGAGIKSRWPPEPFVRLRWRRRWQLDHWTLYPNWKMFWRETEGFGTAAAFTGDRWFGRIVLRSSTGARWTEVSNGLEWVHSFIAGYAHELIDERRLGGRAGISDLASGVGMRYRVAGDFDSDEIQSHEATLYFKYPLRRGWAYLVAAPAVTFRNADDWDAEPSILFGIDALFWDLVSPAH